ncbi:hypothetical protein SERLADRAFT_457489 [Serpula lacrymans var. lacrymans S7.9]|uniref:Uncharacterized protein n=1 Tax=Serpula lacrymans var. lacrymans (strain S7.9) TaxID=578457 RepID=F8NJ77_SERL9|nr:uncharacterized protein SERLADRAFT_457489 [Serpula lacrymans var. lacrymans S7.9]EGO29561.1 hypothetical protein SERLADRAFT_457489 [Serpula lacrymans var. lacrymans S7.9]
MLLLALLVPPSPRCTHLIFPSEKHNYHVFTNYMTLMNSIVRHFHVCAHPHTTDNAPHVRCPPHLPHPLAHPPPHHPHLPTSPLSPLLPHAPPLPLLRNLNTPPRNSGLSPQILTQPMPLSSCPLSQKRLQMAQPPLVRRHFSSSAPPYRNFAIPSARSPAARASTHIVSSRAQARGDRHPIHLLWKYNHLHWIGLYTIVMTKRKSMYC